VRIGFVETIFLFEAESVTQGTLDSIRDATAFRSTVSAGESAWVALLTAFEDSKQKYAGGHQV